MGWENVSIPQFQIARNIPLQGCITHGYTVWKGALQVTASLERFVAGTSDPPVTSDLPVTIQPRDCQIELNREIQEDMEVGFQLDGEHTRSLMQSIRSGRGVGNALLSCISIKQKLNIGGMEVTVGAQADTDLCFWSIQVPLNFLQPEFTHTDIRYRGNLVGQATLKFGLSAAGWRWVYSQLGRVAIRPLLQRLGQRIGQQAVTRICGIVAIPAIIVVGTVVGTAALTILMVELIADARRSGRDFAYCGQYAQGYVYAAWIRYDGSMEAQEADLNAAYGIPRVGITGDQIRFAGVARALQHIDQAGAGIEGARRVRTVLLQRLQLPSSTQDKQRITAVFRDALSRGSYPRPSEEGEALRQAAERIARQDAARRRAPTRVTMTGGTSARAAVRARILGL